MPNEDSVLGIGESGKASTAGNAAAGLKVSCRPLSDTLSVVPYGAPKVSIAKLKRPCSQVIEFLPLPKLLLLSCLT